MRHRITPSALLARFRLAWVCLMLSALPVLVQAAAPAMPLSETDQKQVLTILHLLDYVGVDYGGSVAEGRIIHEGEYAEQREFVQSVVQGLSSLPEHSLRPALIQAAKSLQLMIASRVDAAQVSQATASLSAALITAYPVAQSPRQAPDVAAAGKLYAQQCSGCHGVQGGGDGPLGKGLDPAPANFLDADHAAHRSIFGLYNVITLGVSGTGMASYAHLSDADRWALAFYVSQLSYTAEQIQQGEQQWQAAGEAARRLPNLAALTNLVPTEAVPWGGGAVLAYLRRHPESLMRSSDPLTLAQSRLTESVEHYRDGATDQAVQSALSAYLDGFELAEASLAQADAALMRQIETDMMAYRAVLKSGASVEQVAQAAKKLNQQLDSARATLVGTAQSSFSSFIGSFIILTREGLEVILVLAAIFTFLGRTGRRDALPYVHAGWISALALGGLTWVVSAYVITISGASREVTEGITALLAAIILLSVGLWLHNKSYADRWQRYVAEKMKGAMSSGSLWGLAFLSFIATYREVFETVLFYRALWDQGQPLPIVFGFLAAVVALLGIGWAIFTLSVKLPLRQFFAASSALIVVLSVVFTGHGIAALQEAGWITQDAVVFVQLPLLGIYPNIQSLSAQVALLTVIAVGVYWNHRSAAALDG